MTEREKKALELYQEEFKGQEPQGAYKRIMEKLCQWQAESCAEVLRVDEDAHPLHRMIHHDILKAGSQHIKTLSGQPRIRIMAKPAKNVFCEVYKLCDDKYDPDALLYFHKDGKAEVLSEQLWLALSDIEKQEYAQKVVDEGSEGVWIVTSVTYLND